MNSVPTIRSAEITEGPYLSELSLRSKSHWNYDEDFINRCRPHLLIDEDYIKNWPVRVITNGTQILGFCALKVIDGENRLDHLWLEPDILKQGLGSKLFKDAVNQARQLQWDSFRLVSEPNSVIFYEKMGAQVIGDIPSSVGGGRRLPHMEYIVKPTGSLS